MGFAQTEPDVLVEQAISKAKELIVDRPDMAQDLAAQVLRCVPGQADALELIGLACHQKREYERAVKYLRKAAESEPDNPDFLNNLALPLAVTGQVPEAIRHLLRAIELSGRSAQYKANLALQYRAQGRTQEAIETFRRSLDDEELATTWINLGGTYGEAHRLGEAVECFLEAIRIDPDNAMAHTDLAYSYHLMGDYARGWEEYEWRFRCFPQLRPYQTKYDPRLRWTGQPLDDRRVMFYCEQGLGDAIQFARFVADVKARWPSSHVILHCASSLVDLFRQSDLEVDEYFTTPVTEMTWVLPHDYHASIMSLPFLLGLGVPPRGPYLKSQPHDMGHPEKRRLGICWAGSPLHPNDRIRSCPLGLFRAIHDLPGVKLFNFCDPRPRRYATGETVDLASDAGDMKIVDCTEHMEDGARTASMLLGLDAVITVDTAIMHLAAALGVPTLGLLAYNPDWRWGLEGRATAWYGDLRLFRQPTPGDWDSVFRDVLEHLRRD